MKHSGLGHSLVWALAAVLLGAPASAQKLARAYWEDHHNGYRFRAPEDWTNIPPQPDQLEAGITCKMKGEEKPLTVDGSTYGTEPTLEVYRFVDNERPVKGSVGEDGKPQMERFRYSVLDVLKGASLIAFDIDDPFEDEQIQAKGITGRRRAWTAISHPLEIVVDTYTFSLPDADISLVYTVPEDYSKKWLGVFEKSARSFEAIERASVSFEEGGTYEDLLAYHSDIVARTPGWRIVPTPSKKYIFYTSSTDMDFIEQVIERIELSRGLFERDFPPPPGFGAVSVVRICGSEEEFHSYGDTPRGVGGWFSPDTTELVLFDYKSLDRNATYAVMSHEAFHQYCFYLFDQSEAHRWFDEGHGDYYGGVEFHRGKAEVTKNMPAGYDRLGEIKEMIQQDQWKPLKAHLNFNHSQWQNQGPSNVSCYAQSWSVIYMLRQGMLGKVPSKIWKKEYADIIPNYMSTLHAGFKKTYVDILAKREAEAQAEGRELDAEDRVINRFDLDEEMKEVIWRAAMDASWGQVDLDEFEQDWLTFVRKHL